MQFRQQYKGDARSQVPGNPPGPPRPGNAQEMIIQVLIRLFKMGARFDGARGSRSSFKLESGGGEVVEAPPDQAIDADDDGGHQDGGGQKHIEVATVAGAADGAAEARRREDVALKMEIFGNDGRVPGAAGSGDHASDQVGENSGKDQVAPAFPATEVKNFGGFFQIGGDSHGAGDDVEEDVPLGAEEDQQHGSPLHAAAAVNEEEQNHRKQSGGGDGGGHLYQRLGKFG